MGSDANGKHRISRMDTRLWMAAALKSDQQRQNTIPVRRVSLRIFLYFSRFPFSSIRYS